MRQSSTHLCQRVKGCLNILKAHRTSRVGPREILDHALEIGIERDAPRTRLSREVRLDVRLEFRPYGYGVFIITPFGDDRFLQGCVCDDGSASPPSFLGNFGQCATGAMANAAIPVMRNL